MSEATDLPNSQPEERYARPGCGEPEGGAVHLREDPEGRRVVYDTFVNHPFIPPSPPEPTGERIEAEPWKVGDEAITRQPLLGVEPERVRVRLMAEQPGGWIVRAVDRLDNGGWSVMASELESIPPTPVAADQVSEQERTWTCNHEERNPNFDGHYCNVCKKDICVKCQQPATYGATYCDEHKPLVAPPAPVMGCSYIDAIHGTRCVRGDHADLIHWIPVGQGSHTPPAAPPVEQTRVAVAVEDRSDRAPFFAATLLVDGHPLWRVGQASTREEAQQQADRALAVFGPLLTPSRPVTTPVGHFHAILKGGAYVCPGALTCPQADWTPVNTKAEPSERDNLLPDEARYTTDDIDIDRHVNELVIFPGGNGDWYVGVAPQGSKAVGSCVRVTTSGGRARGLAVAVADAWRAIRDAGPRARLFRHAAARATEEGR